MSNGPTYDLFNLAQLEQLRDEYDARHDEQHAQLVREAIERKGAVQTQELANCGKLFKHRHHDEETGRVWHTWTGDCNAWMSHFKTPPMTVQLDSAKWTGRNSEKGKAMMAKRNAALRAAGLPELKG
jgi:hypothetical protein